MRRIIVALLVLIIIVSSLSLEVVAEGIIRFKLVVTSNVNNLESGDIITAEIRASNNQSGHLEGNIYIDIPKELTLNGGVGAVRPGEVIQNADMFVPAYAVEGTSRLMIAYMVTDPKYIFNTDGVIVEMSFKVIDQSIKAEKNCGLDFGIIQLRSEKDDIEFEIDNNFDDNNINFKQICVGGSHTVAISDDGLLYLWGTNSSGQLGNGTETDSYYPVKVLDNIKDVGLGDTVNSAVTFDGSLYMWGSRMCSH